MSLFAKWKAAVICRLQRTGAKLQRAWQGILQFIFPREDGSGSDKPGLKKKPSLFSAWARELRGIFPRSYLLLAGSYVLVIALLMVIFFSRQGKIPLLDLPKRYALPEQLESEFAPDWPAGETGGLTADEYPGVTSPLPAEGDAGSGGSSEPASGLPAGGADDRAAGEKKAGGLATDSGAGTVTAETETGLERDVDPGPGAGPEIGADTGCNGEDLLTGEPATEDPLAAAAASPLPRAAAPVPEWQLCQAFGEYTSQKLPSGGTLHSLARGASLAAAPAAPVAVLWDGRVSTIGNNSPGSRYVIVRHDGGYTTFYGNLREVWVQEGGTVYRGEHIGQLPPFPADEPATAAVAASTPVPGESGGEVPLRTIWKGVPGDSGVSASWPYHQGNPLLYLEVRQGNKYLDPLSFIGIRN